METFINEKHRGPNIGVLAVIFTFLFIAGLSFVISSSGHPPYVPGPWEPADTIADYFRRNPHGVLMCGFFQFGSAIPLGLLVVNVVSRLRFLGIRAAGPSIALFGGLMTTFNVTLSALLEWVMAYPGMAQDTSVIRSLYYMVFAIGGVGYSVPLGIFFAGVSISAGFAKYLPKWLVIFGLVLAVCGELSWLSLIFPQLIYLIPLTRFTGYIWLIFAGFKLPRANSKIVSQHKPFFNRSTS
jgi:hypothetical protein